MTTTERRRDGEEEEQTPKKPKTTQQQSQQQEDDKISQLPDDILCHILSLIAHKEGCNTTALSKRWQNLFPSLPRLQFDDYSFFYSDDQTPMLYEIDIDYWLGAARHILQSHRAPVRICTIRSFHFEEYGKEIGYIIRFLCNNSIQELSIYVDDEDWMRYTVPSSLYFCPTLTRIELSRCILKVPANFSLLRRLSALKIVGCTVEDDDLQWLILGCRAVERLTVEHCHMFQNLVVDAPKLAVLDITTHRPLEVSMVNAPLLESVTLRFRYEYPGKNSLKEEDSGDSSDDEDDDDAVSRLVRLLKSLGGIQNLTLEFQNRYLKKLWMKGLMLPETLGSLLPKMKKLTLKMQLNLTFTVSTVSCLLNTCPNLEDLVIVLDKDGNDPQIFPEFPALNYWDLTIPSDSMRNTLCTVTFNLEKGCCWAPGIELVKFLLKNALVLKNLVIDC